MTGTTVRSPIPETLFWICLPPSAAESPEMESQVYGRNAATL